MGFEIDSVAMLTSTNDVAMMPAWISSDQKSRWVAGASKTAAGTVLATTNEAPLTIRVAKLA